MAKIVQLHRMATAQAGLYTGPAGEVIVDTGSNRLLVQDGLTPGGFGVLMASLNLRDLGDVTVARTNLGAAPLANPNFTGGAQVDGDTICRLLAAQTLMNKQLTSPTLVTPILGTPASGNLTNCTGYDAVDLAGLGAGVATLLGLASTGTAGLVGKTDPNFTRIGIGMAPSNILDITQTQNSGANAKILNASAGTVAYSQFQASNGTHSANITMYGIGYTTSGAQRQDGMQLLTDGAGGMTFSIPSDAFRWSYAGTQVLAMTNTDAVFIIDVTAGHYLANGAGGGSFTCSGFGVEATLDFNGSINTTSGNGMQMVCVSNGVVLSNGASAWAAISDYRAKNVLGLFTDSGQIIDSVPVHLAALKETPENVKAMFLAHEVQAALPYAVHGEKDGEEMQVLESTDPLMPIVWAELRSMRARMFEIDGKLQ